MNIRDELLRKHSKKHIMRIVKYIGQDATLFDELMQCFLGNEPRVNQRAAWAVNYSATENSPHLFYNYMNDVISLLNNPDTHHALKRNIVRVWEEIYLPEEFHSAVIESCFNILLQPSDSV